MGRILLVYIKGVGIIDKIQ